MSKAYRIYDIEENRVMISRDVTFNESVFAFSPTLPQESVDDTALDFDSMIISDEPHPMQFKQTGKRKDRSNNQERVSQRTLPARHGAGLEEASAPEDLESRQAKRRSSTRTNHDEERKGSGEDDDDATPQAFWQASANIVEGSADLSEPTTFKDAVGGQDQVHWRKAICAELDSMKLRGVFRATKLPAGQHTIGTKWVFKIKRKADGSIEKYKARLVAKGFKQKQGIDYTETFSPVVKYVTLRMVIAITKYFDWSLYQLDVVTGFLVTR